MDILYYIGAAFLILWGTNLSASSLSLTNRTERAVLQMAALCLIIIGLVLTGYVG